MTFGMTDAEKFCEENNVKFRLQNIGENIGVVALEYINMLEKENKISEAIIIGEQQEINELKKKLDFFLTETVDGKEYRPKEELEELENEIERYKALESHYEEIEEDAKAIAKENEELKTQIKSMKKTLTEISEYADEKPIHNIAQNELDKWEKAK